jgi:hypothetical protein
MSSETRLGAEFDEQLTRALEHFSTPAWLGEHSPFAAPYFLGRRLNATTRPQPDAAASHERRIALYQLLRERFDEQELLILCFHLNVDYEALPGAGKDARAEELVSHLDRRGRLGDLIREGKRQRPDVPWDSAPQPARRSLAAGDLGEALQELLREAASGLEQHEKTVLDLAFFQPQKWPWDSLHMGRTTFYRHRDEAVRQLGQALIRLVQPALRPAAPPLSGIVGREPLAQACVSGLAAGKTVALTGLAGVGKTALGRHVCARLSPRPLFWFTLCPGLNDQLTSLLFWLSYFLFEQGAPTAWLQFTSSAAPVNVEILQGLVRSDLTSLGEPLPLLCFDEMELLNPVERQEHALILHFLQSLRGITPLLLIGQQLPYMDPDVHHTLPGLSPQEASEMLARADVRLAEQDLARLYGYTQGNPRMLNWFITLHRAGQEPATALENLARSPSSEFMLDRIAQHLDENERDLLGMLSVFRRPAPSDEWPEPSLTRLAGLNLLQMDSRGGVELLPALKAVRYGQLYPEDRERFHLKAAHIRARRGEYTAAAYHLARGGEPRLAVGLMEMHLAQEIGQGQGPAALAILREISQNQLEEADRQVLVLLRGKLGKLLGQYDQAIADLLSLPFWKKSALGSRASSPGRRYCGTGKRFRESC